MIELNSKKPFSASKTSRQKDTSDIKIASSFLIARLKSTNKTANRGGKKR